MVPTPGHAHSKLSISYVFSAFAKTLLGGGRITNNSRTAQKVAWKIVLSKVKTIVDGKRKKPVVV